MPLSRFLPVAALLVTSMLSAQVPQQTTDMVKRIFASRDFAPQRFGPARWLEEGTAYTTVEKSEANPDASDIVRYATASGERSIYISARQLVAAGATDPLEIEDYSWSADGKQALIFTNSERVWRQNTRGDFWVLDRVSGRLSKLGGDAPASTLMYAKFSPQGDRVAYVRQGDIYVERVADGAITRITSGADSLHVHGMSDWVYEEEFDLRDGFRWSPDGTRIAYTDFDMTGVGTFVLINNTDSLYPQVIPIQYPKAGTTNSAVRIGVVSASGGPTVWIQTPGDARDNYIPRIEWAGPQELVIQRINRRQDTNLVLLADAATGSVRTVMTEKDSAWVDVVDDLRWLEGGKRFLWVSERDGWRHAYLVNRVDGKITLATPGAFDVSGIAGVDEKSGWLYYIASPDNATQRYLWRVKLSGTPKPERLTPTPQAGLHTYRLSPDNKWAFHTWSAFDTPPTIELVSLPDHKSTRVLADNAVLRAAVAPVIKRPVEFFKVPTADGTLMDGWMIKPADFDSTKAYPILMYVYGEVAGQTVLDSWSSGAGLWYRTLADQGYIVASVDNRGTPAPKGRHWRKQVYGAIGILSSSDQADAVRALTRTRAYIDPGRVAIWGWSGGGSSTLQALFRYPDLYQVGMSVAPVPDERLYDTIYQERYSGLLPQNADAYEKASAITYAEGLKGRLLLVHGSGDDNVHYQGSEKLVNRLIELGKSFDFMTYPNRSHCICEGTGTTLHVYSLLTRYLNEHLPAGPVDRRPIP
ncbi:MAG: S9 family peptidase [Gemmatimonadetes bacterium]|nr:S9 family peptidase [Gemmatimonadota bacterium]